MFKVPVNVEERSGIGRTREPVTIGIPVPCGLLSDSAPLSLLDDRGENLPLESKVIALWGDGSVRWVLINTQVTIAPNVMSKFSLQESGNDHSLSSPFNIKENEDSISIDTGAAEFVICKHKFKPFSAVSVDGEPLLAAGGSVFVLRDQNNTAYSTNIETLEFEDTKSRLQKILNFNGVLKSEGGIEIARFIASITFHAESSHVDVTFTLDNPRAAKHPGGLWDLGDPGSIMFNDLSLILKFPELSRVCCRSGEFYFEGSSPLPDLSIYQASSGGENRASTVHKNADGRVPELDSGFTYTQDQIVVARGDRVSPVVYLEHGSGLIGIYVQHFWQNFPKAIAITKNQLQLKLFPDEFPDAFELQGGERKTHKIHMDFNSLEGALDWIVDPLIPSLSRDWYVHSGALPYMTSEKIISRLSTLVEEGLSGENNFFEKRELVDEFGWRNFGELYADHEALYHAGEETLISHYNNQYDAIYGFVRQYLETGKVGWLTLLNDLAEHVVDIDIYHTQDDRDEYNGGLFWHTNHYLDADTCTHRTFSKGHPDETSDGASGGGASP